MLGQDNYMLHLNHGRLLGVTCNLFLSKLKCSCEASALLTMFVGCHLQKDSLEIFILSSLEAVKMWSSLLDTPWSQPLVCITWVMTTWVRSQFFYIEHPAQFYSV